LGATYAIAVIDVPVLMITHGVAFYPLLRAQPKAARALVGEAGILASSRSKMETISPSRFPRARNSRATGKRCTESACETAWSLPQIKHNLSPPLGTFFEVKVS
jgi:hypothetical protein